MMKRTALGLALVAALCLTLGNVGRAGKDGGDKGKDGDPHKGKITESAKSVQAIHTAIELVQLGRDKQHPSPEALLLAAQILHQHKTGTGDKIKIEKQGGTKPETEVKPAKFDPQALVDEALKMPGAKEPHVAALAKHVQEVLKQETKGAFPNPISSSGVINPKQDIFLFVQLKGGEYTNISLNSPDGVDLDLYLYKYGNSQPVASDTSVNPNAFLSVFVPVTEMYKIRILNYSSTKAANYILTTN